MRIRLAFSGSSSAGNRGLPTIDSVVIAAGLGRVPMATASTATATTMIEMVFMVSFMGILCNRFYRRSSQTAKCFYLRRALETPSRSLVRRWKYTKNATNSGGTGGKITLHNL